MGARHLGKGLLVFPPQLQTEIPPENGFRSVEAGVLPQILEVEPRVLPQILELEPRQGKTGMPRNLPLLELAGMRVELHLGALIVVAGAGVVDVVGLYFV